MTDDVPVRSVGVAFDIIEYLVREDGATVNEITQYFDQPYSTVHDYVKSLRDLGYLMEAEGRYKVSPQFLWIGEKMRSNMTVYDQSKDELEKIARETGEHVQLLVEVGGYGRLMNSIVGGEGVKLSPLPGAKLPLHATASGKALLSFYPPDRAREIVEQRGLSRVTPNTITDTDAFYREMEGIRERGYAIDREEILEGMYGIGAPIISKATDEVLGAISIYTPSDQREFERFEEEASKMLLRSANVITINIHHSNES